MCVVVFVFSRDPAPPRSLSGPVYCVVLALGCFVIFGLCVFCLCCFECVVVWCVVVLCLSWCLVLYCRFSYCIVVLVLLYVVCW